MNFDHLYIPIETFKQIVHYPSSMVIVYLSICAMETANDNQVSARSISEFSEMALSTVNFCLKKLCEMEIVDCVITSSSAMYFIRDGK